MLPVSTNLEIVRSIYAAWESGDYSSTEWAHPGIEFVIADGPSAGSWEGRGAMAGGWRAFLGAWDNWHTEAEEYRELDDERVLVLVQWKGRGKTSGLELEQMGAKGASVFHIRNGRVSKQVLYFDRVHAFSDLGLSE